jgi:HD-GYP domain-containing protein (c-di-GMP phosphodiesterase class II)
LTAAKHLIGRTLANDVVNGSGILLIAAGVELTESHVKRIQQFSLPLDSIELNPMQSTAVAMDDIASKINVASEQMSDIHNYIHKTGTVPIEEVEKNIIPSIQMSATSTNIFRLFSTLKSKGDYRYKHSIGVAVISTLLGKWLGLSEDDLVLLATAATLYDIGSIKLPASIYEKEGYLSPNELEIVKRHTQLGYEMLSKTEGLHPRVGTIALQHHEREDGSGYPNHLPGSKIDPLAKVVAVADVFLAMTSERPYRSAHPFYYVVEHIHSAIHTKFDAKVAMTFLNNMMDGQTGNEVILSDGQRGTILLINSNYPTQPRVLVGSQLLDLSTLPNLTINEILG